MQGRRRFGGVLILAVTVVAPGCTADGASGQESVERSIADAGAAASAAGSVLNAVGHEKYIRSAFHANEPRHAVYRRSKSEQM